jgi:peptidoglycan-associated lipoprotein
MSIRNFLLVACLGATLAACTDGAPWNGDDGDGATDAVDLNRPGLIGDQTSPAYFQQAIGDRVFFAVDQSTLSPDAQAILAAQASWLLDNPDYTVTIEGHADEQGTREYNLALGASRANEARDFLVSRGVPASRLKVVSYGKERPVEICSDESCYSQNRRAVTVLTGGLTG